MIYTFREEAVIYTTVEADSEEQAWEKLDEVVYAIPPNMEIDEFNCEIVEIGETNEGSKTLSKA
jgi:hypothetical protein